MFHWMRKHRRTMMIAFCIVIIPTFVMWGGYAGKSRAKALFGKKTVQDQPTVVAMVGKTPISVKEFQERLAAEVERRSQYTGKRPTAKELAKDGTAERVLDGLIDSKLLSHEIDKASFAVDRDYLIEKLKDERSFKDENGNFSITKWNAWIDSDRKRNWKAIYGELQDQVGREVLLRRIMSPARVLDSEVRKQFEENFTKLQIKYVVIDPAIEPTEEQVKAEYDKDPSRYQIPEKRDVEFVAVSMLPARPALIDELLKRARAGEDFAELAKQNSQGSDAAAGGSMEWVSESPTNAEQLKALFTVPIGTISDVIEAGGGYYIFKAEEERVNEKTGAREVKASEIVLRPKLDDAERAVREQKAQEVAAKAKEAGDLKAAGAAGLKVQTSQDVAVDSESIQNVPMEDRFGFRTGVAKVDKGEISDVIKGRSNVYVVKVIEVKPPVAQPLEAVREKVVKDAIEEIRRSPEHGEQVRALAEKVAETAHSLPEIVEKFPALGCEIKETKEFTRKDYLFTEGLFLQTVDVFEALGRKDPGAFAGPVRGMRNNMYFLELVKKTPPTEENWKTDWPKEEENLRKSLLASKRTDLLTDYLANLRERADKETPIQRNPDVIARLFGTEKEEPESDEATAPEEKPEQTSNKTGPVKAPGGPIDLGPPASE